MKVNKKIRNIAFGVLSFATIGLMASSVMVSAYQGDPTKQGPNYDADLHDLKTDAFESKDYEVWKDLMEQQGNGNKRVMEVVNEENFNTFVEAHNAALEGDFETSNELRASLGLNNGNGPKDGSGQGMRSGRGSKGGSHQGSGSRDGTCNLTE